MSNSNRYALLIVFEYNRPHNYIDTPKPLLSMITDLNLAWDLCRKKFLIEQNNITVITDLKNKKYSWLPTNESPNLKLLDYPDIRMICREIAQFIENTIRGIKENIKGEDVKDEVFIYISCHGLQIPSNEPDIYDNALHFTNEDGTKSSFLRNDDIFKLLFGHNEIEKDGSMMIPITNRKKVSIDDKLYYQYDEEMIEIEVTPLSEERIDNFNTGFSPKSYNGMRGLPRETNMFMIIDSCNSGKMAKFHYIFNPATKNMELTHKIPTCINTFPLCVCVSATEDKSSATSTTQGSAFTRYLYKILKENNKPITIHDFYELIYSKMPIFIKKCNPTITSTSSNSQHYIPLIGYNN